MNNNVFQKNMAHFDKNCIFYEGLKCLIYAIDLGGPKHLLVNNSQLLVLMQ